jgi:hypothetical protein
MLTEIFEANQRLHFGLQMGTKQLLIRNSLSGEPPAMNNVYFSVQSFCINKTNLNGHCHCNVFAVTFQNFEMASNFAFSKKLSKKGNLEMRTNFDFQRQSC